MKHILFCILLLASLSACIGASASGAFRCDEKKELCIKLTAEEPIIIGEPVNVTALVTSKNDIQDIVISLSYVPARDDVVISVVGIQKQAIEIRELTTWVGGLSGFTSIQANQPLTFTWQLLAPEWEGFYSLNASVSTSSGIRVTDSMRLYFTNEGGQAFYAGTQIAVTPPPPVSTIYFYTYTPGPSPTWASSATFYPQIATREARTQQAATPLPAP